LKERGNYKQNSDGLRFSLKREREGNALEGKGSREARILGLF